MFSMAMVTVVVLLSATAGNSDPDLEDGAALGTLEVTVISSNTEHGEIAIALFANAHDYSTQSNAVRRAWLPVENGRSRWTIASLPVGEYALIAYQDLNGNRQIDMRVLGMPKEPVGVSNDARGLFGPPRFEAAKFALDAPITHHELKLR